MVLLFYSFMVLWFFWFYNFMVYCCLVLFFLLALCFLGLKNTTLPFHDFRKISISDPRFPSLYYTNRRDCSAPAFAIFSKIWISIFWFLKSDLGFSWMLCSILRSPKIKINGFGAQGRVQKSRKHRNDSFWSLP